MGWNDIKNGLLKREGEEGAPTRDKRVQAKGNAPTVLGASVVLEGQISSKKDILIEGKIKGEVRCEGQVIIAAAGKVEGKIRCRAVIIYGVVNGNVDSTDQITIEASGKLIGDIRTKRLINQPGGFFEGYSHMVSEKDSEMGNVKEFAQNPSAANQKKGNAV